MPKMRLGWYAGVSNCFGWRAWGKLYGAMADHHGPMLTFPCKGLNGPRGQRCPLSLLSEGQLLFGNGISCPEQLLSTGTWFPQLRD